MWNLKFSSCLLSAMILSGCQTTPAPKMMQAPSDFEEGFFTCGDGDGELLARLLEGKQVIEAVPLDWVAWQRRGWAVEGTSPFGQTLFRLTFDSSNGKFSTSGALSRLPSLTTNEDGYLVVDGRWIGLKPEEIPCFFSGKVPVSWLKRVVNWQRARHELVFTSQEKGRSMYVRMEIDEQNTINFCSRVIWQYYWGLVSRELTICSSSFVTSFSGYQDYRLEFERQNGT